MKQYVLLIKGFQSVAVTEARKRLPESAIFEFQGYREKDNTSTLRVEIPEANATMITDWFIEKPKIIQGVGFPNGTLLFYNEVE